MWVADPIIHSDALLELTGDAVIRIGSDFCITDANDRALLLVRLDRDEAIGRHLWSFLPRHEIDDPQPEWDDFYHRRIGHVPMAARTDMQIRRGDGSGFEAVIGAMWLDDDTAVIVFNQFEGRLDAERRIAASAQQYQDLFQNLPLAVWENDMRPLVPWIESIPVPPDETAAWLRDRPGLIREHVGAIEVRAINRAAAEQLVADSTEPSHLAQRLVRSMPDEGIGTFPEQIQAIRLGVQYSVAEGVAGRANGDLFHAEVHQYIPRSESGLDLGRVLVTIIDTSDSRRVQRELADAVDARGRLITSVAHELRTPLTVVVGLMHSLSESHRLIPADEVDDLLALASAEADDLSHLVDDLLTYSRIERGDHQLVAEDLDLRSLVDGLLARSTGARQPSVTGDAAAIGDSHRVRQIVRNLVTNADRYGGPTIEIRIEPGDPASLRVRDDGPGVADGVGDVFAAFEQTRDGTGRPGSIGLGLTISRSLAEAMGGALTHRRVDGWTVFELTLPGRSPQI